MSRPNAPEPAPAPDTERETSPDAVAKTVPGHAVLPSSSTDQGPTPNAAPVAVAVPPEPSGATESPAAEAQASSVPSMTRMTKGGTQISSFRPSDDARITLDSADHALSMGSGRELERPVSSALIDERFREIERRLDRIDARMRLLEKGAEQGATGRAALIWWVAMLAAVIIWALLSRLR